MRLVIAALALIPVSTSPAIAKDADAAFTGPHGGAAVTAVNHHFVVTETAVNGDERSFNVLAWGVGGQGFAGYDLAIAPRLRIGGEAQIDVGGRTAQFSGADYGIGITPRYGGSVSARLGYLMTPGAMVYAGAGYGAHNYRGFATGIAAGQVLNWNRSFILRGGVEFRLIRRAAVRVEFEHLDGTRNQFAVGIPIRF